MVTESPAFSVLVAAYNQAEWVEATLDSLAAQTCRDWELVVVDDGSTDGTGDRVAGWIARFQAFHPNRCVLARTENGGQSAAMEHGFALCRGRWIALLDSDDLWLPDKLARVAEAAAEAEAGDAHRSGSPPLPLRGGGGAGEGGGAGPGMIVHPLHVIDAAGNRTGDIRPKKAKLSRGDLREEIRRTSRIVAPATSGMVIRADVFARLVPMPTKRFRTAADMYLALGAALLAPVHALDEPLAEYRMHPDGQHVRTMLSPEGLGRWVELQDTLARHFGLEDAARRSNSYFVRHEFALAKLRGGAAGQASAYGRLLGATWRDGSFGPRERLLFTAWWTACLLSPRPLFRRLWRTFQMKQTGFDRIGLASTRPAGI